VRSRKGWFVLAGIVGVVLLVTGAWVLIQRDEEPAKPSAFYTPPDPVPDDPPGTILRSEPIDDAPSGATATRVLYASTDPNGTPIAVSGVVFAPTGAVPDGGRPVVAWAHGTSGVASRCAPSLESGGGASKIPELAEFLDTGAVVVFTDYPGLGTPGPHPYLVGESEGRAVLDSVRAAQNVVGDGASDKAAILGHSQGGHSTLFAAELAPTYAPELDVVGVAAMAPPTDLAKLMEADQGTASGILLTAMAIESWAKFYPDTPAADVVDSQYLPAIEDLDTKCIETNAQDLIEAPDIADLRRRFLAGDPADSPAWKPHFVANSPAVAPLTVPLFVAQGATDEIVHPEVTQEYVRGQCAAGGDVELKMYPDTGHFALKTVAAPDVFAWLTARIDGAPTTPNCPAG
jgi:pimeloyl-ACP methyl ester carboxylesterase